MVKSGGRRQGVILLPDGVEKRSLPISVQTVVVDGKRMTPAFYKQLTEKRILNEKTGDLNGFPLGYFHLHTKECPQEEHTHLLWGSGTHLHLNTVVALEHDEQYQKEHNESLKLKKKLLHLLTFLLVLADEPYTIKKGEKGRYLTIADYDLYIDGSLLEDLENRAEMQSLFLQDIKRWQAQLQGDDHTDGDQNFWQAHQNKAEEALKRVSTEGIELAHPTLFMREKGEMRLVFSFTGPNRWFTYPYGLTEAKRSEALLYWRKENEFARQEQDALSRVLDEFLKEPLTAQLLRLLLIERCLEKQRQEMLAKAEAIANAEEIAAILPKKSKKVSAGKSGQGAATIEELDQAQIWACYQQEWTRFKKVTEQWERFLAQVATLDQLFLLS